MSKYIKLFDTTAQYTAYTADTANFIKPNVSLAKDAPTTVYFNAYDPYNGHDYVEIGGLKWATMNIGANSVTDYGLFFQWGDTQGYTSSEVGSGTGKKYFYWDDYKYWTVDTSEEGDAYKSGKITKYNSIDGKTVLDASDDAAVANWGGSWRMPTTSEYVALGAAVNSAWTNDYQGSGVHGIILTDKTDSSKTLFFPGAGYCDQGSVIRVGSYGRYWSSSIGSIANGRGLSFDSSSVDWQYLKYLSYDSYYGFSVRGVVG